MNDSNTDGSFIVADLKIFLIAQVNILRDILGILRIFSYFIMKVYAVCVSIRIAS